MFVNKTYRENSSADKNHHNPTEGSGAIVISGSQGSGLGPIALK